MKPIIITNFKTFKEATGKNAVRLAKMHEKIMKKANIFVAVQAADIYRVSKNTKVRVIAQHVDYEEYGKHTGKILPEDLKDDGAVGSLINHAEDRISLSKIKKTISRCKKLKLKTIVCVESVEKAKKIAKFKPDYIAFEYPKLIGTLNSISKVKPDEVRKFAQIINKTKSIPLCGAGIANNEDFRLSLKLGTKGVLLATAITKAKNPGKALKELVK